jgi:hypothetical protein
MLAFPKHFVGVNKFSTIQGLKYDTQNVIKVIENKQKNEFYLYSSAYIIDYSSLNFRFENF